MIALLIFMLLVGVGFAIYGLSGPQPAVKLKPKKNKNNFKVIKFEDNQKHNEAVSLKDELEKASQECARLKQELGVLQGKDAGSLEEISRREEWVKKSEESANKAKGEFIELEKKFLAKENELQAEFSKNVDLGRQLRETKTKADSFEKENSELSNQLQEKKMQVEKLVKDSQESSKQIQEYSKVIDELKKKSEQSEWVSKADYTKLEEEIRRLKAVELKQIAPPEDKLEEGNVS